MQMHIEAGVTKKHVKELITLELHEMTSFWAAKHQQNKSENVANTQNCYCK